MRPLQGVWLRYMGPRQAEMLTFLLVGALNTVVGYSTYAAGYVAGLTPHLALAFSVAFGIVWNFNTYGRIVFGSARWSRLPLFAVIAVISYAINSIGLRVIIDRGVHPLPAEALVLCYTVPANFVLSKFVIFKPLETYPRR